MNVVNGLSDYDTHCLCLDAGTGEITMKIVESTNLRMSQKPTVQLKQQVCCLMSSLKISESPMFQRGNYIVINFI